MSIRSISAGLSKVARDHARQRRLESRGGRTTQQLDEAVRAPEGAVVESGVHHADPIAHHAHEAGFHSAMHTLHAAAAKHEELDPPEVDQHKNMADYHKAQAATHSAAFRKSLGAGKVTHSKPLASHPAHARGTAHAVEVFGKKHPVNAKGDFAEAAVAAAKAKPTPKGAPEEKPGAVENEIAQDQPEIAPTVRSTPDIHASDESAAASEQAVALLEDEESREFHKARITAVHDHDTLKRIHAHLKRMAGQKDLKADRRAHYHALAKHTRVHAAARGLKLSESDETATVVDGWAEVLEGVEDFAKYKDGRTLGKLHRFATAMSKAQRATTKGPAHYANLAARIQAHATDNNITLEHQPQDDLPAPESAGDVLLQAGVTELPPAPHDESVSEEKDEHAERHAKMDAHNRIAGHHAALAALHHAIGGRTDAYYHHANLSTEHHVKAHELFRPEHDSTKETNTRALAAHHAGGADIRTVHRALHAAGKVSEKPVDESVHADHAEKVPFATGADVTKGELSADDTAAKATQPEQDKPEFLKRMMDAAAGKVSAPAVDEAAGEPKAGTPEHHAFKAGYHEEMFHHHNRIVRGLKDGGDTSSATYHEHDDAADKHIRSWTHHAHKFNAVSGTPGASSDNALDHAAAKVGALRARKELHKHESVQEDGQGPNKMGPAGSVKVILDTEMGDAHMPLPWLLRHFGGKAANGGYEFPVETAQAFINKYMENGGKAHSVDKDGKEHGPNEDVWPFESTLDDEGRVVFMETVEESRALPAGTRRMHGERPMMKQPDGSWKADLEAAARMDAAKAASEQHAANTKALASEAPKHGFHEGKVEGAKGRFFLTKGEINKDDGAKVVSVVPSKHYKLGPGFRVAHTSTYMSGGHPINVSNAHHVADLHHAIHLAKMVHKHSDLRHPEAQAALAHARNPEA